MTAELLAAFEEWLSNRPTPTSCDFVDHAEMFLDWRANVPLSTLSKDDIRTFLLVWCPRHLTLAADQSREVCEVITELLLFLGATRRLHGGANRGRALARLANSLADDMRAAMADPANYGMAKSLFAGIDDAGSMTEKDLRAAMQEQVDEYNALPLEQRKALTDRLFAPQPQTVELPFVYVAPPEAEVAAVAAGAELPRKIEALRDYLGEGGKPLTAKGNLKLADGRALVEILDTGDEIDPKIGGAVYSTRSTAQLRQLTYVLTVARESGAVRCVRDRVVPVKTWSRKSPVAKATALFQTVIEFGVLSLMYPSTQLFAELHGLLDDGVVHWLAGLLAPNTQAEFDDVLALHDEVVSEQFQGSEIARYLSTETISEDLGQLIQTLEMTGAIHWAGREESHNRWGRRVFRGGRIALTAFGRQVLPPYLPAAGIALRTAVDLTDLDVRDLMDTLNQHAAEQHSSILATWQPALPVSERAGLIAAVVAEADDAYTRLAAMRLLGMFDTEVAESHMRQLLDTAAAGHAAIWLLDHGLADGDTVGGFVTPAVMVDVLAMLLDYPDVLCEQFVAGHDPQHLLDFFWRHRAPETAAVLDALGQHLPDRDLAKQARKAAIKHRSWLANEAR